MDAMNERGLNSQEPTMEAKNLPLEPYALRTINLEKAFRALKANSSRYWEIVVLYKEMLRNKDVSEDEKAEMQSGLKEVQLHFQRSLNSAKNLIRFCIKKTWYANIEGYIQWFTFEGYDAGFSAVNLDGDKGYKPKAETRIEDYDELQSALTAKESGKAKQTKSGSDAETDSTPIDTKTTKNSGRSTKSTIEDREAALRAKMLTYDLTMWAKILTVQDVLDTMNAKVIKEKDSLTKSTKRLIRDLIIELNPYYQEFPWKFFKANSKDIKD